MARAFPSSSDINKQNVTKINKILKKNKIIKVKQLANKSKTKLKDIGLLGDQITEIEVKLQLEGLDLINKIKVD